MSRQLTCDLGITPETLSSWRDNHLPATEKTRIGRHIPDCDACRGTLTEYEVVAHTLLRQGDLDPGNRVWRGVQIQIARSGTRRAGFTAFAWRSAGATLALLLVVTLFAVILRNIDHFQSNTSLIGSTTSTQVAPTPTEIATPGATATPTSLNQPGVTQSWGPNSATLSFTLPFSSTLSFQASDITPNGQLLLGDLFTTTGQGVNAQQAGYIMTSTTGQFIPLAGMPTSGKPDCCQPDSAGRYILATDSTAPGATGSSGHIRLWIYDLQTQQIWLAATGQAYGGITRWLFDHGLLIFNTGKGVEEANPVTRKVTALHLQEAADTIDAYTWPYLIYSPISSTGQAAYHVLNLQTQTESILAVPGTFAIGAIAGDTLFATNQTSQGIEMYEIDHFTSGVHPHLITTYPAQDGKIVGANDRLIAFQGTYPWAWDRAENHFVAFLTSNPNGATLTEALTRNALAISTEGSSAPASNGLPQPQFVSIYDTSKLPLNGNPPPSS